MRIIVINKVLKNKQNIIMMHYQLLEWDKTHRGSWHLHGHNHKTLVKNNPEYYKYKVLDVYCNGFNYTPIYYLEVKTLMENKTDLKEHN